MLQIDLNAEGSFRLHFPTHSISIPATEKGALLLQGILQFWYIEMSRKVGTPGSPTQAQVLEILLGEGWGEPLQLAGDRKRFADIKSATGIKVRRFDSKNRQTNLSLEDLDL